MGKDDAAKLIDMLIGELGQASKQMRETQKQIDDFVKELTKSKDDENVELQKLVQKRQQLFNTLNAIVNKYDESAKKVIQQLGRG